MQSTQEKIKFLSEAIKREDHNQVYQFSKQILKDHPQDIQYQQCFIISSIKISLTDELGHHYFKNPPTQDLLTPLYAYYLYDRGQFDKAIQYISTIKNTSNMRLLLAQAYFRAQNYQKSAQIMIALLKEVDLPQDERQQYMINILATGLNKHITNDLMKQYEKIMIKAERKELLYNYSLMMLDMNQYQKCLHYLKEFQSGLVEGRDDNDLVMVRLFKDFMEWKSKRNIEKGTIEAYEKFEELVTDKNVEGVLHNNLLFFKQGHIAQNTHETLKMMDESLQAEYKMTKKQRGIIHLNKLCVLLKKGRFPQAQKLIKEIEMKEQLLRDTQYIKNKYYLMKKNKDGQILKYIQEIQQFNSELGYCLRADYQKEKGTETNLIADLKAPKGKQITNPIIKNYIFSLLIKHSSLFEQYSDYLSEMAELTSDTKILQILLNIYENKHDIDKQKYILLKLLKLQPKSSAIKIKLAKIYLNESKLDEAQQVLRGIQGPQELGDIAYLQFIEKNIHISIKKEQLKEEIIKENTNQTKKRIKKKKKVRLPKHVQKILENFKGDPQRWLPKWQRKGYKKKGKKGAGKTQGLATIGKQQTKNVFTTGASTSAKEVTKQAQKKRKN